MDSFPDDLVVEILSQRNEPIEETLSLSLRARIGARIRAKRRQRQEAVLAPYSILGDTWTQLSTMVKNRDLQALESWYWYGGQKDQSLVDQLTKIAARSGDVEILRWLDSVADLDYLEIEEIAIQMGREEVGTRVGQEEIATSYLPIIQWLHSIGYSFVPALYSATFKIAEFLYSIDAPLDYHGLLLNAIYLGDLGILNWIYTLNPEYVRDELRRRFPKYNKDINPDAEKWIRRMRRRRN